MKHKYNVIAEEVLTYKTEFDVCPICGAKLEYRHSVSNKIVLTLSGSYRIINLGYGCPNEE